MCEEYMVSCSYRPSGYNYDDRGDYEEDERMDEVLKDKIETLREIVWLEDIPSPCCPEYVEHHESIAKILKYIDTELLKGGKEG